MIDLLLGRSIIVLVWTEKIMEPTWLEQMKSLWGKRSPREKNFLRGYVVVLMILLLWPEDGAFYSLPDNPPIGVKSEKIAPKQWDIRGLKAAQEVAELRDPFDITHPTVAETAARKTAQIMSPEKLPKMPTVILPEPKEPSEISSPAPTVYRLRGTAAEGDRRLALVSDGQNTFTLAVGDTLSGRTVLSIGEDYLLWQDPAGEQKLTLGDERGRE